MTTKEIIFNVIDEFNEQFEHPSEHLEKNIEMALYGTGSKLDSLGLVNFITIVEQTIEDETERSISLANEKAMSRRRSPFKTIGSLIEYIDELLEEDGV